MSVMERQLENVSQIEEVCVQTIDCDNNTWIQLIHILWKDVQLDDRNGQEPIQSECRRVTRRSGILEKSKTEIGTTA